jgi:4-hydroxyphenylpyruvate dioxygenase-like putative hemolysin
MDRAVEYYESLGIGPFQPITELIPKVAHLRERIIRGEPAPLTRQVINKLAKVGPVFLELLQPLEEPSFWRDFLETKGEGVQHLAFLVDDIDAEEARLVEKGVSVTYRIRFEGGGGDTYFETYEVGGVLLAIVQF